MADYEDRWGDDRERYRRMMGEDRDRGRDDRDRQRMERGGYGSGGGRGGYGGYGRDEDFGRGSYGREDYGRGGGYGGGYGREDYGREDYGRGGSNYGGGYGREDYGQGGQGYGSQGEGYPGQYRGGQSWGGMGRSQGGEGPGWAGSNYSGAGYGRERQGGRDPQERGFWNRATDEVASWFGSDDAEQRRRQDEMRAGQYRGRGPRGYTRSDDRIREDVNDRLTDDPFVDASAIDVSVSSCEVTLSGTVDNRQARRRAEDIAESVSGVRHVQNNIRVHQEGMSSGGASTWTSRTTGSSGMTAASGPTGGTGSTGTGVGGTTSGSTTRSS